MSRAPLSSLRARLFLLVLLALVPSVGLIVYTGLEQRRLAALEVQERALQVARSAASAHERLIEGARQLLATLGQLPAIRKRDSAACSAFLAELLKQHSLYANLGAITPNGDVFCSALPLSGPINVADRAYFRLALETRTFAIGEYQIGRVTGKATVNFGYPVLDEADQALAVVVAALDLAWLNQLPAHIQLPPGWSLTVIDRNGTILARHPDPGAWVGKATPETPIIKTIVAEQEGVVEAPSVDGVPSLFGFTPLRGTPEAGAVYVSLSIPKAAAVAEINRILARNLIGLGIVGVLTLVAAWVGADLFILRRANALVSATKRLAAGDLSTRTGPPYDRGELGHLARAFDEMAVALQTREAEATRAHEELQRQREVLFQSEKLAAMGDLVAGVAHELNNPLSVITGRTALLRQAAGGGSLAVQAEKIAKAADRCARIVRTFLALARQYSPERQRVALNQVVQEALELLAYQLRLDDVEVIANLAEDLPPLWADPHQLHQLVVNLVNNAQQAMREKPPPRRLTLTTRSDPSRSRVYLAVADTGPGIPPEIQPRIFEPFFTTKPPGQGTGLGLSLCQRIIEGHGGSIRVESEPGHGAVFLIELPVEAPAIAELEPRLAEALPPVRGKTILVVDDEPGILEVLTELLSADDHLVETAAHGAIALEKLRERAYDLILTDIKMPQLDGPGLYRELERSHPGLLGRIIFFTGDTLGPATMEFLTKVGAPTINKPFSLADIRRAIGKRLRPTLLGTASSGS